MDSQSTKAVQEDVLLVNFSVTNHVNLLQGLILLELNVIVPCFEEKALF